MLFLRNSALLLAGFILLVHTCVPHQHGEAEAPRTLVSTDQPTRLNLLELLKNLFGPDLGDDHLEVLRKGESDQLLEKADFGPVEQPLAPALKALLPLKKTFHRPIGNAPDPPTGHWWQELILRGPPLARCLP